MVSVDSKSSAGVAADPDTHGDDLNVTSAYFNPNKTAVLIHMREHARITNNTQISTQNAGEQEKLTGLY